MPKAQRNEPLHLQIAGHYKRKILDGDIRSGQQLPSVREIRDQWEVGQQTAQRAVEHLRTEGLVRTGPGGTFANGHRAKYGPQQRIRAASVPRCRTRRDAHRRTGRGTRLRRADPRPARGQAGVLPGDPPRVDHLRRRRRAVHADRLLGSRRRPPPRSRNCWTCSRCPTRAAPPSSSPAVPGRRSRGGAPAVRPGRIRDDGREGPLLRLPGDAHVLAEVYQWWSGDDVLEYGEYVILEDRVIESDMEP